MKYSAHKQFLLGRGKQGCTLGTRALSGSGAKGSKNRSLIILTILQIIFTFLSVSLRLRCAKPEVRSLEALYQTKYRRVSIL